MDGGRDCSDNGVDIARSIVEALGGPCGSLYATTHVEFAGSCAYLSARNSRDHKEDSMPDSSSAPSHGGVKDVTAASFKADVISASARQPVLVDFWAPWCGPCKQLAPALEKAVADSGGKVKLVKMNIDEHPQIAGQLGIQSIPAVIAFDKGQPIDGFMGALPESQVRGFIERLVGPLTAGADDLIAQAQAAATAGDPPPPPNFIRRC